MLEFSRSVAYNRNKTVYNSDLKTFSNKRSGSMELTVSPNDYQSRQLLSTKNSKNHSVIPFSKYINIL